MAKKNQTQPNLTIETSKTIKRERCGNKNEEFQILKNINKALCCSHTTQYFFDRSRTK